MYRSEFNLNSLHFQTYSFFILMWYFSPFTLYVAVSCDYYSPTVVTGARGGAVGWGTALQGGKSRVQFPMVSVEFSIDIILPAAPWLWRWLSISQKWVTGIFTVGKGGRCVGKVWVIWMLTASEMLMMLLPVFREHPQQHCLSVNTILTFWPGSCPWYLQHTFHTVNNRTSTRMAVTCSGVL